MDFQNGQQDAESRKAQIQKGLIEVVVELDPVRDGARAENLLAYPIGNDYAQIASIPFFASSIGVDDIVQVAQLAEPTDEHIRDFVRIIKKNTNTFYVNFDAKENEPEKGDILSKYFLRKGLRSESFAPGVFAIAVPVYFNQSELEEIINLSPYPLVIEED